MDYIQNGHKPHQNVQWKSKTSTHQNGHVSLMKCTWSLNKCYACRHCYLCKFTKRPRSRNKMQFARFADDYGTLLRSQWVTSPISGFLDSKIVWQHGILDPGIAIRNCGRFGLWPFRTSHLNTQWKRSKVSRYGNWLDTTSSISIIIYAVFILP